MLVCFICLEIFSVKYFYLKFIEEQEEKSEIYLDQNLDNSVNILERELDKISIFAAGIKSFILHSQEFGSSENIRQYIRNQLKYLQYSENVLINFIDANHNFVYSIGTESIFVNDLQGKNVLELRSKEVLQELDDLLKTDNITAFTPLNLYEGFVGLPIDFRYKPKDTVEGYFAIIVDIKNILTPIIDSDINDEFTFRFFAKDDIEFDREIVHDGTKVYHDRVDYNNMNLDPRKYSSRSSKIHDLKLGVGIAFKEDNHSYKFSSFIKSTYNLALLFLIGTSLLLYLYYQNFLRTKEQVSINKELEQSNHVLRKFVYASSHDLKQPLVNISNFQKLLSEKFINHSDQNAQKFVQVIQVNIDRMSNLLEDLLIYAQIIQKDQVKALTSIKDILDKIVMGYDPKKVKINYANLQPCYGNKSELSRLFQNLISNSIKYNDNDQAIINIRSTQEKNYMKYTVTDNGIGIKPEHEQIVFQEFQRVNHEDHLGTGLGLSICKEIVNLHGGKIWAKGLPSGGTSITFKIAKK